jgi:hypothetical protein
MSWENIFKNTLQVRNPNLTCVGYWNTFVL